VAAAADETSSVAKGALREGGCKIRVSAHKSSL